MIRSNHFKVLLIGFVLMVAGCDSATDDSTEPPAQLRAEAFMLETNLFAPSDAGKAEAGTHFAAAALRVWPVSVILSVNLIVPVAVTAASLQVEPEQEGNTWTWSSSAQAGNQQVGFTLRGTLQGRTVLWSMRVTAPQQALDDFELYTAETDITGLEGSWQLYYPVNGQSRNVLDADFTVFGEGEAALTYSIPQSAAQNSGDAVRYEVDDDTRVFLWEQVAEGLQHHVTWDAITRAGSITATNFNNGEQACWDEALEDTACAN